MIPHMTALNVKSVFSFAIRFFKSTTYVGHSFFLIITSNKKKKKLKLFTILFSITPDFYLCVCTCIIYVIPITNVIFLKVCIAINNMPNYIQK